MSTIDSKSQYKFEISEERIKLIALDFLMLGQQHKLTPAELVICMRMADKFLSEELGLSNLIVEKPKEAT